MSDIPDVLNRKAKALCDRLSIPATQGTVFVIADELFRIVLIERDRCAKIASDYPKRDPAEDGNGYWAASEIEAAILASPSPEPQKDS